MTDDAPIHQGELGAVARAEAAEARVENAEGRAVNADAELARREEELENVRERGGSLEAGAYTHPLSGSTEAHSLG
jgi:transcriptional regulator of NAD metabolism